jgi:hypothetical protein
MATTHPIEAYGGIQLAPEALAQLAEQFNTGSVPFAANHNHLETMRTRNAKAYVRARADGYSEVVAQIDVAKEDWERSGSMNGISFSTSDDIGQYGEDPGLYIYADASWFSDFDIVEAGRMTNDRLLTTADPAYTGLKVGRYFQFSIIPDAKIVLEVGWTLFIALGPNLVASAIWDGVKHLFAKRKLQKVTEDNARPTTIDMHIQNGQSKIVAVVTTDDEHIAKVAIDSLAGAIQNLTSNEQRVVLEWKAGDEKWVNPSDS